MYSEIQDTWETRTSWSGSTSLASPTTRPTTGDRFVQRETCYTHTTKNNSQTDNDEHTQTHKLRTSNGASTAYCNSRSRRRRPHDRRCDQDRAKGSLCA